MLYREAEKAGDEEKKLIRIGMKAPGKIDVSLH